MIKRVFKKVRYIFEYAGVLFLYGCVKLLPYRGVVAISGLGGFILYLIPPFRKLVSANLRVAFPEKEEKEIRRLTRGNLKNTTLLALEFFWFRRNGKKVDASVRFDDGCLKMLDEFDSLGKGGMWVPPHLGNWELMGMYYRRKCDPKFAVVVRRMNNPYLDAFVNTGRSSEGTRVIYAKGAVKEMMKALRGKFYIATLIDQNTKGRDGGVFVDFFGLPVPASRAPAMFARKMNLPVTVACCVRENRGFVIHVNLLTKAAGESFASDEEFTQAVMNEIEGFVKRYPEQYLWLYERWRHIPADIDDERLERYPYYSAKVTPRFYDNNAPKPVKS
jgi:KDO2-lipid IV(A) lauroyltransferase